MVTSSESDKSAQASPSGWSAKPEVVGMICECGHSIVNHDLPNRSDRCLVPDCDCPSYQATVSYDSAAIAAATSELERVQTEINKPGNSANRRQDKHPRTRAQVKRRRETQDMVLAVQPRILSTRVDFRRAERLALQYEDTELKRFLMKHAQSCVIYWIKYFKRHRKAGRPRKAREAEEALKAHEAGKPWSAIGKQQTKSKDAARKLARSRRPRDPGENPS